jgi:hypothetical protein
MTGAASRRYVKADRVPRKVRIVRNPDCWVVLATYRHFWPNGDAHTVQYGGDTRRAAVWSMVREVMGR